MMLRKYYILLALVAIAAGVSDAVAQEVTEDVRVRLETGRLMPSRIPVHYISAEYSGLVKDDAQGAPVSLSAVADQLRDRANWRIERRVDNTWVAVDAIHQVSLSDTLNALAYAIIERGVLRAGDTLHVQLRVEGNWLILGLAGQETRLVVQEELNPLSYTFDPKQVNGQKLRSGSKTDVTQFGLRLEAPSLLYAGGIARIYLRSDNVFSTNKNDVSTRIAVAGGAERSLLNSWYVPGFLEVQYQTNQPLSNSSVLASVGAKSVIPWRFTRAMLWNGLVRAPISPLITAAGEFQRRIEVDSLVAPPSGKDNLFRVLGQLDWNPVYLLPGRNVSEADLLLKLTAKSWYFPDEDAAGGNSVNGFETFLDVSLLIPVSGSGGVLNGLPIVGSGNLGKTTFLKVQYVTGASETNGFVHSSSWKLGFEVAK